ncbi:WD repeat-containing protein 81 [Marchantia polymorpha subsp. ruderalis]|uniref:Non-specific serine/threonine protein kinase n=1 Tax=Marchantia polymorpha TaxID=3197 RepID=A0A2R6WM75_MARPO|nr:hypothetical protein MARPO_0075s0059 [Marchantia polymorpha]BBN00900.1 hypothetical protein Mp_2g02980 [Marchantia polymorpha subsp. ruderalis]|eukprot:PTQ34954.1 hypothetical protein MARPO_0075s0059 [Marchantia polymorpha]
MDYLSTLQLSLHSDFSNRVLLLHGLSGWPPSSGSYVICEVESSSDPSSGGTDSETQFVVQAIPRPSSARNKLTNGVSVRYGHEVQEIEFKEGDGKLPSPTEIHEVGQELSADHDLEGRVDGPGKRSPHSVITESTGHSNHETVSTKDSVAGAEASLISCCLAVLAPGVHIKQASYDELVRVVKKGRCGVTESKSLPPPSVPANLDELTKIQGMGPDKLSQRVDSQFSHSQDYLFSEKIAHPNLAPALGALQGKSLMYILYQTMPLTVESLLHFSPSAFGGENHIRLIIFQILSGLDYCHKQGLTHGDIRPSNLLLTENLWCMITGFFSGFLQEPKNLLDVRGPPVNVSESAANEGPGYNLGPQRSIGGFSSDWRGVIKRWWAGEVSNYDYLLLLNKLAGRRWGDPCFHTVVPWVIDFSVKPEQNSRLGWRDLTKSKWRLAKGDEQLDFTYASAEMPHHVSDECLSELAVCIYKARRLPLLVLRRIVRSVYEPNEYPANMQRLYQWTPDECVPEFYCDSHIFESSHVGMNDLAVPTWATNAKDFISLHRAALESERVSQQLHHWIDLTFGYKLSGKPAVDAKNVTLSTVGPTVPRSSGRRQLFFRPHPRRLHCKTADVVLDKALAPASREVSPDHVLSSTLRPLECLEEVISFSEAARYLCPAYKVKSVSMSANIGKQRSTGEHRVEDPLVNSQREPTAVADVLHAKLYSPSLEIISRLLEDSSSYRELVECLYVDGDDWEKEGMYEVRCLNVKREEQHKEVRVGSEDIFAAGCLIAELYLRKPLFDPVTANAYNIHGTLPGLMDLLPPSVRLFVECTLDKDLLRRPTASMLLQSQFFSPVIRAVYYFLAPLNVLRSKADRLRYVAIMARQGAFQSMGPSAAEMCTPSCLSLVVPPSEDIDVDAVVLLVTKLLRALNKHGVRKLLMPVLQRLLQSQESLPLKTALLQVPLVKEVWRVVGTPSYLLFIHSSILACLRRSASRTLATAASKVLVSMCLDLGVPITLHQTVLPLLQAFGRDITPDHIEVLIGLGEQLGEKLVVKHLLPTLRNTVSTNVDYLITERPGPAHSWRLLAMVDALAVLDRLRNIVSPGMFLRELLQEPRNVYMKVLLQPQLPSSLLQCAARALLLVCDFVGAEATVMHVLPQLKQLFDGLAFAGKLEGGSKNGRSYQKTSLGSVSQGSQPQKPDESTQNSTVQDKSIQSLISAVRSGGNNALTLNEGQKGEGDIALVHILYPGLASLVGIERLRQGLTTWLLLEQALLKHFNWKWEGSGVILSKKVEKPMSPENSFDSVNPANLLLDGVGWSIPQSQASKWSKSPGSNRRLGEAGLDKPKVVSESNSGEDDSAWAWVVSKDSLVGFESFARIGIGLGLAHDESSWNLTSTIIHSWKAHTGLVRSTIVAEDENSVYTAGGGPRGGSVVRQWRLSTSECVTEYAGHEEAVNDVCILPGGRRVASCDGTLHIWNAQTGQRVAFFDESSSSSSPPSMLSSSSGPTGPGTSVGENGRVATDVHNNSGASMPNHSLTGTLTAGGLYTCMHGMEAEERLVTGMVNGSLRFFDIVQGRQSYLWRCEPVEGSLTSFVSAIASSGQGESMEGRRYFLSSSWIAVGFGSGLCRLVDYRSGSVVTQWRAHEAFITKLSVLEERYLVSSSLDKTVSLWDIRRVTSPERLQVFRGHKRGVTSFAMKGCDILSAAGNKIGLSSLSQQGGEKQTIQLQKLFASDPVNRLISNISAIAVLPFSRLFLIGTDDGCLKICT